ncbi:MAG TPA: hypothetical protein VL371_25900 [Gemmataceae bacterium]|nr:hypothetical protein [Gemmataceae bacterium]
MPTAHIDSIVPTRYGHALDDGRVKAGDDSGRVVVSLRRPRRAVDRTHQRPGERPARLA